MIASWAPGPKSRKVWSWSAAAYCRWAFSLGRPPRLSIGQPVRFSSAGCRPTRWSFQVHCRAETLPDGSPGPSLYCAVIVKIVDAQTRAKTSINELLRD